MIKNRLAKNILVAQGFETLFKKNLNFLLWEKFNKRMFEGNITIMSTCIRVM